MCPPVNVHVVVFSRKVSISWAKQLNSFSIILINACKFTDMYKRLYWISLAVCICEWCFEHSSSVDRVLTPLRLVSWSPC